MRAPPGLRRAVGKTIESLEQRRLLAAWVMADPFFGDDGLAGFGATVRASIRVALPLAGGKILAVGHHARPDDSLALVARLNPDGSLDTTFSGDGIATAFVCAHVSAAVVQPDGRVLVGGQTMGEDMFVARFNADGTPDAQFGTAGMTVIPFQQPNYVRGELWALALSPGGKVAVTGAVLSAQNAGGEVDRSELATARLNADGSIDTAYGHLGTGKHALSGWDMGTSIAALPDGRMLVGGFANGQGADRALVIRYLSDGRLDTAFADNGILRLDFDAGIEGDRITALQPLPDGAALVAGGFEFGGYGVVQRIGPDGTVDGTFGAGAGRLVLAGGRPAIDMAVDGAGRLVLAFGMNDLSGNYVARALPAGVLDTTFGPGGRAFVRGDTPRGVDVDATDRVLVGQDGGLLRIAPRPDVALSTTGTLYLTGGDGDDNIAADVVGDQVRVVRNGVTTVHPRSAVLRIDLLAGAGNDTLAIGTDVPVTADLGAGADRLTLAATTPSADPHARHLIACGDGNDTVSVGAGISASIDGGAGNDRITAAGRVLGIDGGAGNDVITTTGPDPVTILGGVGTDSITTGAGADLINAGRGNDTVASGGGADTIHMGFGSDSVLAGDGDDVVDNLQIDVAADGVHTTVPGFDAADAEYVHLGDGTHRLALTSGRITIVAGAGGDTLAATTASLGSEVSGGGGGDQITTHGPATIYGGEGDDLLDAVDGGAVYGDAGDDTLITRRGGFVGGGAGNDALWAYNDFAVTLRGGDGNDLVRNWVGRASIYGEAGYDTLYGGIYSDLISGGGGKDRIDGGAGNDRIYGGANNDQLKGGRGRDRLFGGDGDDKLFGFNGDDTLDGGAGVDCLCGGMGRDLIYARDGEDDWLDGGKDEDTAMADASDRMVSILTLG